MQARYDVTDIIFDQYQRYKTIELIVSRFKQMNKIQRLKVLEVGANEHRNLEKFLPDDDVYFSDLILPESMVSDPRCFVADATDMPEITDGSYDICVALDVFEHISPERRHLFIKELLRVSKYGLVFCFPIDTPYNESAENRANYYYKSLNDNDFIWLQEHRDCGLPDIDKTTKIIKGLGVGCHHFEHGDVLLWEQLLKTHFYTDSCNEMIPYRLLLDKYYNQELFLNDRSEQNYRAFFATGSDALCAAAREVDGLFSHAITTKQQHTIDTLVNDIYHLRRLRQDKTNQEHSRVYPKHICTVFMDDGDGFTQDNSICLNYHLDNEGTYSINKRINIASSTRMLRIDPVENAGCLLDGLNIISNMGELDYSSADSWNVQGMEVLTSHDPQLIIPLPAGVQWIELRMNMYSFTSTVMGKLLSTYHAIEKQHSKDAAQLEKYESFAIREEENKKQLLKKLDSLNEKIDSLEDEKDNLHFHYSAAIQSRDQYQHMYESISTSSFWRMTKPFRRLVDLLRGGGNKTTAPGGVPKPQAEFANKLGPYHKLDEAERKKQKDHSFGKDVMISVLVPIYNTPENYLREMIESVQKQTYSNWELCLADASDDEHSDVKRICQEYAQADRRVVYKKLADNKGIAENTNAAIDMAQGDYLSLLDHDDILHASALYEVMCAIVEKGADFIYTDEMTFEKSLSNITVVHAKPDFAIDNLRANNYICHLSTFSKKLQQEVGYLRHEYDGSQDYDFVLRLTEQADNIVHIPKVLYFWRSHPQSVASNINAKLYCIEAAKKALKAHFERCGLDAEVYDSAVPSIYRIKYALKEKPLVSIIIPNKDHYDDLKRCIDSITQTSTYSNCEIIIMENNSENPAIFSYYKTLEEDDRISLARWDKPFNYAAINNEGARLARGKYLLFLNNDTEVITPDWIQEMLMYAQREDVAAVGAKLYYPDDTIQHAGVAVGVLGVAGHVHLRRANGDPGYMGRLVYAQNYSAVTGACLMVSKDKFMSVGGFDEDFVVAYNDIDLCLRLREEGYLNVWTPFAELYHYESLSREADIVDGKKIPRFAREEAMFREKWWKYTGKDPYFSPHFDPVRNEIVIK